MTAIVSRRDAWLAERRKGVGASEVAAILGVDPRRGPLSVYADKVADKPSEDDEIYLAFGREVEGAIARGYARKTGRVIVPCEPFEIIRHPDFPIVGATLDFEQTAEAAPQWPAPAEGTGILETKAVGFHKRDEWREDPPLWYVVQVQIQLACRRRAWGSLGALMGGISIADPVDILPDPELQNLALEVVARFWRDNVEARVPPIADAKPDTRAAIRRLYAGGAAPVVFDRDDLALVNEWEIARDSRDAAQGTYDGLVNRLAVRLGDATTAYLPDGSRFSYSREFVPALRCGCGAVIREQGLRRVPRRSWPKHLRPRGRR